MDVLLWIIGALGGVMFLIAAAAFVMFALERWKNPPMP
jgi:hypothetical protein